MSAATGIDRAAVSPLSRRSEPRRAVSRPATPVEADWALTRLEARLQRIHDRIVGRATRYRGGSDFATPEPNEGGPS